MLLTVSIGGGAGGGGRGFRRASAGGLWDRLRPLVQFWAEAMRCFLIRSRYDWNQSVVFSNLPFFTLQTWTQPPPSWSSGVMVSGGTSPPSEKSLTFSMPFLTSSPLGAAPALALMALRTASTCNAAIITPRL